MAEFPMMPLYTDAYLADTMHLSIDEHGAYLKLLIIMWRTSDLRLPDDDKRLARMLGISMPRFAKLRRTIAPFFIIEDDVWRHKKLEKVRQKVAKRSAVKSERGARGAKARWLKNNETDMPQASVKQCLGDGIPYPIERKKESSPPCSTPPNIFLPIPASLDRRRRATRIPDGIPNADDHDFARSIGMTEEQIRYATDQFRDYWTAKPGQAATKLDWHATWRSWCRRDHADPAKRKPHDDGGWSGAAAAVMSRFANEGFHEDGCFDDGREIIGDRPPDLDREHGETTRMLPGPNRGQSLGNGHALVEVAPDAGGNSRKHGNTGSEGAAAPTAKVVAGKR